jgi:hypothetical protein
MDSLWSRGNGTASTTISLKNVATGISYETLSPGIIGNFTNITRNNLSVLTATTSTAPYGQYQICQDSGSGPDNCAPFWFTATGATISWGQSQYYSNEPATVSWTVSPAYWDTNTYTYSGAIVDVYGTTKTTWPISSSTGQQTTQMTTTLYPSGTYFATITATLKASPFTSYILNEQYTQVSQSMAVQGVTYNATTNAIQPSVFINFTQGATTTYTQSAATTGTYSTTSLYPSTAISFNAFNGTGLQFTPISFAALGYGNYTINLYATKNPINMSLVSGTNSTIYGLVQSSPYYNAVSGATVTLWNATNQFTTTSNSTGFYNFTRLAWASTYSLNASSSGVTSPTSTVNSASTYQSVYANATRQDLLIPTTYPVTFTFKDSSAFANIPAVTVTDSNGYSTTTTNGIFTYNYSYSIVSWQFSATGYSGSSTSYTVTAATSQTIYLAATTSQSSYISNWYSPHIVRIAAANKYGTRVPGVAINCTAIGSTFPAGSTTNWVQSLYGVNPAGANDLMNSTLIMQGITAGDGSATFTMLASIGYSVQLSGTMLSQSPYTTTIYPVDNEYTIWMPGAITANNNTQVLTANATLTYSAPDPAHYILGLDYQDISGTTDTLIFQILDTNGTMINYTPFAAVGSNHILVNVTLNNIRGDSQTWSYSAHHP